MQTRIDQINDRIYRISTCVPEAAPGDCPALLRTMADVYEQQFGCGGTSSPAQPLPGHDATAGARR